MTAPDSALAAALLQITQQAERSAALEERVAGNLRHTDTTLASMSGALTRLQTAVDGQVRALKPLGTLREQVASLAAQVAEIAPSDDRPGPAYQPRPAVAWWALSREDRDAAVAHLRAWVEQVYRPYYGHLAETLAPCWEEHRLILVQLDWLSELHSVLYCQPGRTAAVLSAQAEYGTRIVPTVSEQFARETSKCRHAKPAAGRSPWAGAG